jgi:hypothetical protein
VNGVRWLGSIAPLVLAVSWWACSAAGVLPGDETAAGSPGSGGAGGVSNAVGGGASVAVGVGGSSSEDACADAAQAQSSYGCEFWAVKPDTLALAFHDLCFAVFVANTSSAPAHLEVSLAGVPYADTGFIRIPQGQGQALGYAPYDPSAGLPAGEVAILFLSHETGDPKLPACPVPPALYGPSGVLGTGRGQAFLITSDRPVTAHSIYPYGTGGKAGLASASLLLPASGWDTSYLAVNAYEKETAHDVLPGNVPSLSILAREEGTEVTVLPKVAIEGGPTVASAPGNAPVTYTLGSGEYLQISQEAELTGSVIQANKPIGLWGSQSYVCVPAWANAPELEHQQIPPIRAWGSRYAGVRHRNRLAAQSEEAPPWRLVGAVDGTELSWTPNVPAGAPTTLDQGELAEFFAPGPFVVESQHDDHPFYLAQYMTGFQYSEGPTPPTIGEGDAEWVNVVPVDQYLDRYVFFTDPTFPETNLVVVRKKLPATQAFADVTLDCAGALSGWQPLGDLEYTRIDLVTGNYEPVNGCDNGRHEMTSAAPFAVTVWGWGGYSEHPPWSGGTGAVSYAYPAGAGVASLNDVDVPPTPE